MPCENPLSHSPPIFLPLPRDTKHLCPSVVVQSNPIGTPKSPSNPQIVEAGLSAMPPLPPSSSSPESTMRSPYTAKKSDNASFSQSAESSPRYSGALGSKMQTMNIFQFILRPILFLRPLFGFANMCGNIAVFSIQLDFCVWNSHFPLIFFMICLLIPHSAHTFFSGTRSGRFGRNHKTEWRHAADRAGGVCYQRFTILTKITDPKSTTLSKIYFILSRCTSELWRKIFSNRNSFSITHITHTFRVRASGFVSFHHVCKKCRHKSTVA
jgi:hypothetical protein